jgi:anti-sigma B factor antagonist
VASPDSRPNELLLTLDVEEAGDALVIRASGELDISTTPTLDRELQKALDGKASAVTVDLSGLSFIDSTGLRLLTMASAHSKANGKQFRILRGESEAVVRTLELTGLDNALPVLD